MSGQQPPLNPAQVEAILVKAGFTLNRNEGSHFMWEGDIKGRRCIVPVDHLGGQRSETFSQDLLNRMIRESGLTKKEFYGYHWKK